LLLALGCAKQAEPSKPTAANPASGPKTELVVYAASSTRDALQALETLYEKDHNVDLVFNFGSSGDLSKQIAAAAKADVFLSADDKEMDRVEQAGLVLAGSRRDLLSNQLVVIEPVEQAALFSEPFVPSQLANARVKRLSLANVETVPAGRYAKTWLEKAGVWKDVADRVLPGVDVRAALGAVESGGAQAGIVYRTDIARSQKARLVFAVPIEEGPQIRYSLAVIRTRPSEPAARAFAESLASTQAKLTFEQFGFIFLPTRR
jgi:molybdate transport system substrate-binding protein